MPAKKNATGHIMDLISVLKPNETFISHLNSKAIQSYASRLKVAVRSDMVLVIENYGSENPTVTKMSKVTIL